MLELHLEKIFRMCEDCQEPLDHLHRFKAKELWEMIGLLPCERAAPYEDLQALNIPPRLDKIFETDLSKH